MAISGGLAAALARINSRLVGAIGNATVVNGVTVQAVWKRSQPNRVQQFLDENHWGSPAYDVIFSGDALQAPVSLKSGIDIRWPATGWIGVVRAIDVKVEQDKIIEVRALVTLETGK